MSGTKAAKQKIPHGWIVTIDPNKVTVTTTPAPSAAREHKRRSPAAIIHSYGKSKEKDTDPRKSPVLYDPVKHNTLRRRLGMAESAASEPLIAFFTDDELSEFKKDFPDAIMHESKNTKVELIDDVITPFLTDAELAQLDPVPLSTLSYEDERYMLQDADPYPRNGIIERDEDGGKDVYAFIIDTGIASGKEAEAEFDTRILHEYSTNLSPIGSRTDVTDRHVRNHGTWCASRVGGNGFGIAPAVKLIILKWHDPGAEGDAVSIFRCYARMIEIALEILEKDPNARFISNESFSMPVKYIYDIRPLSQQLLDQDIFRLVAAGNAAIDSCGSLPAALSKEFINVYTIGAINEYGNKAWYSNHGIRCTSFWQLGNGWALPGYRQGTSMAAPEAAGLCAVLIGRRTGISQLDFQKLLYDLSRPLKVATAGFDEDESLYAGFMANLAFREGPLEKLRMDPSSADMHALYAPPQLAFEPIAGTESVGFSFTVSDFQDKAKLSIAVLAYDLPKGMFSYINRKQSPIGFIPRKDPNFNARQLWWLDIVNANGKYWVKLRKDSSGKYFIDAGTGEFGTKFLKSYALDKPQPPNEIPEVTQIFGSTPLQQFAFFSYGEKQMLLGGFQPQGKFRIWKPRDDRETYSPTTPATEAPTTILELPVINLSFGKCYYSQFTPVAGGSKITLKVQGVYNTYEFEPGNPGYIRDNSGGSVAIPNLIAGAPIRFKIVHTGKTIELSVLSGKGAKKIDTWKSDTINKKTSVQVGFPYANVELVQYSQIKKCSAKAPPIKKTRRMLTDQRATDVLTSGAILLSGVLTSAADASQKALPESYKNANYWSLQMLALGIGAIAATIGVGSLVYYMFKGSSEQELEGEHQIISANDGAEAEALETALIAAIKDNENVARSDPRV